MATAVTGLDAPACAADTVHRLPCRVEHDGPAPVRTYFAPRAAAAEDAATTTTDGVLEASFRGRRLLGVREALPEGSTGLVVAREFDGFEEDADGNEVELQQLHVATRFQHVTHWRHDEVPAPDTAAVPRWLAWVSVARVLHASAEEGEKAE